LTKSQTGIENPNNGGSTTLLTFPLPSVIAINTSPKAVLSFHFAGSDLLYASYAIGFKSGTFNIVNIYEAPNYIVPEEVTTYELGAKLEFMDGLLRVNGALFDNQIRNLQSGFVSLLSGGAVSFETAPAARTRGAEFDGTLVPLPDLDQGLAITANGAFVDAIYTSFAHGQGFGSGTGIYNSDLDFDGHKIVRSPRVSGGVGLVQSLDVWQGTAELAVDEYYNSGFYYDPYNTAREGAYFVLNSHASYLYSPWNTRLTVFGKNLLDRRYHLQQFQTDFGITKTLAPPCEFGLRISWNF
jgi:iron complex outermembrane receptor protein